MNALQLTIFLPLVAFLLMLLIPKDKADTIRLFALVASLAVFIVSLLLIGPFWFNNPGGFVFQTDEPWIASPVIRYHVGIDGLSLWLVLLSTLLTPTCILLMGIAATT